MNVLGRAVWLSCLIHRWTTAISRDWLKSFWLPSEVLLGNVRLVRHSSVALGLSGAHTNRKREREEFLDNERIHTRMGQTYVHLTVHQTEGAREAESHLAAIRKAPWSLHGLDMPV